MAFLSTARAYGHLAFHLLGAFFNLLKGIWKVARLPQAPVSIFGSGKLKPDNIYMQKAHELSHMFANAGIPVLSGGGPGIMEAVNCGAIDTGMTSTTTIGISVKGLDEQLNCCAVQHLVMKYFFSRKWLLIQYSIGFVVFPGGFGTLDELAELLTLIKTNMRPKVPVVLIGVSYWDFFMKWIKESAVPSGTIAQEDAALFTLTDDINEAFTLIKAHYVKEIKLITE
jgi:uncharacterized protein (TIGR00730 family)